MRCNGADGPCATTCTRSTDPFLPLLPLLYLSLHEQFRRPLSSLPASTPATSFSWFLLCSSACETPLPCAIHPGKVRTVSAAPLMSTPARTSATNNEESKQVTDPDRTKSFHEPHPSTAGSRMCTLEKRGRIFVLTLTGNNEHRLGPDLIDAVRSAIASARADTPRGSALVTTADGRFFSNGFDLAWAEAAGSPTAARARLSSMVQRFAPVVADLMSLPMPTIAAVTGHAAAAGFMLALCHDYVMMRGDRGFLYMSEINMGLPFPPYFMSIMLSKITDPRALRDVALRGAKIPAAEAVERGIIDRVYGGAAETLEAAMRLGDELAGRNWDGGVYASIRQGTFPEICRAVGLPEDDNEEKHKVFASKL